VALALAIAILAWLLTPHVGIEPVQRQKKGEAEIASPFSNYLK